MQCILCADEVEYIGVGECNHEPICYRCTYKMRVISKNNSCPICKTQLKNIIIMDKFIPYNEIKAKIIPDIQFGDVFHVGEGSRDAFEKLTEYKCFIKMNGKPCKSDQKFPSIAFLKKHLKEQHNRYVCEICVDKKTCVLQQQKLYTYKALNRHLQKGDIDQFGNITFLHPYCKFCSKNFFDQDQFKLHINVEHITCNVCGKQHKYRYYKNYDSLEVHYKMTHYLCGDQNCLAKKFIAFRNAEELKLHRAQVHDRVGQKKINMKDLCGFQYEGYNPDDEIINIRDTEGVNMEDQFLNLKKCKNKALGEADMQEDRVLDLRVFYECVEDEDEHFQEAFMLKHRKEGRPQTSNNNKKKKYVTKQQLEKEKPAIALENQTFFFEELSLIHTLHHSKLNYDDFENRLKGITSKEDLQKFIAARTKMNKRQLKPQQFFQQFLKIMTGVSLKSAYLIFPHYLRTVTKEDLRYQLDDIFIAHLKKVQSKYGSILSKCERYSDLFRFLLKEIEDNLEDRIRSKKISIKKPIKRGKERLYQIIGVVRRLKIQEMARFKYATNFGVQKGTVDFILDNVYKKKINQTQDRLDSIQNEQLLDLYIFVKFCNHAVKHSKTMHIEKSKIHEDILEDLLFERPYLEKEYGLKKEELKNLDQQVQFQKVQEEKRMKQTLKEIDMKNQKKGFQIKTDFNLLDKGDFPELVEKKEEVKRQDRLHEVLENTKDKPATYQKKINEMFPTLESVDTKKQPRKEQVVVKEEIKGEVKQGQTPWWQKINHGKKVQVDEQQPAKVRSRKGKKQKWVSVKGVFN